MTNCVHKVREQLNLDALSSDIVRPQVNRGMTELYKNCFADFLSNSNDFNRDFEKIKTLYEKEYLDNVAINTKLYDGIYDALKHLKTISNLILITNKPAHISKRLLEKLDIDDCYVKIMGGDSCAENKPSPLPLKIAAEELDFDPAKDAAYMWGDSVADIKAGNAFGAKTIWCSWGYTTSPEPERPDCIISHPSELIHNIKKP